MEEQREFKRRKSDYEPQVLSPAELRDMMKSVNKELVTETFEVIGVNISDEASRAEVRKDFAWLRGVREGSAEFSKTLRKTGFATLATALIASLVAGWKLKFGGS